LNNPGSRGAEIPFSNGARNLKTQSANAGQGVGQKKEEGTISSRLKGKWFGAWIEVTAERDPALGLRSPGSVTIQAWSSGRDTRPKEVISQAMSFEPKSFARQLLNSGEEDRNDQKKTIFSNRNRLTKRPWVGNAARRS